MTSTGETAREWSAVATAWDEHVDDVDGHSTAATEALLRGVAVRPGDRLLELAAGPGSLGPTWSELVGPTGSVTLSDIAPGMVDVARRRNEHLGNVTCAVVDASSIDRPDDSFDVVACRMGLMFAPDPAAALAEFRRVLAAGGRFGALVWAGMEHNPWMTCVGMAAMTNDITAGVPPMAPGGIFSLGDPADLAVLVKGGGFIDVAVEEVDVTFTADSVEAHIEQVSALAGPLACALRDATPDQQAAVRRSAADLAGAYVTADGVVFPGRALLVTGRV